MARGHSKTSKRSAIAREREAEAFEMRKEGKTYAEIGEALGVSDSAANKAVLKVLGELRERTGELAESVMDLEISRLDMMLMGLWEKAITGHGESVDRVLRIMKRRADLLGLDAPKRTEVKDTTETDPRLVLLSDEELEEMETALDEFIGDRSVTH